MAECFIFLFPSCQEEDVDFLAKFSRLVNGMGQSLVLSWTKLAKAGNVKDATDTLQAVEAKVPLLLQLLVHEDDDISANIVGFCYEYLHVLKQVLRNRNSIVATKSSRYFQPLSPSDGPTKPVTL